MNTIEIPQGIRLADEASETNYQKAMDGTPNQYGFLPMIVIASPRPGSGKTMLARHILKHRFGAAAACQRPTDGRGWEKMLPCSLEAGYLFLDNVAGEMKSETLSAFLTSPEWSWRPMGKSEMKTAPCNVQVIITGNGVSLSEDLMRRALWIELA